MRYRFSYPKYEQILSRESLYAFCRRYPKEWEAKMIYLHVFSGKRPSIKGLKIPRTYGYVIPAFNEKWSQYDEYYTSDVVMTLHPDLRSYLRDRFCYIEKR